MEINTMDMEHMVFNEFELLNWDLTVLHFDMIMENDRFSNMNLDSLQSSQEMRCISISQPKHRKSKKNKIFDKEMEIQWIKSQVNRKCGKFKYKIQLWYWYMTLRLWALMVGRLLMERAKTSKITTHWTISKLSITLRPFYIG